MHHPENQEGIDSNNESDDSAIIDQGLAINTVQQPQLMAGTPGIYEVAGISLEEIVGNEAALKLVLHTFRQAVDENSALKQQQNFNRDTISRFQSETLEKTLGSVLSFLGSIPIAFGVSTLAGTIKENYPGGWASLAVGILLTIGGLVLSVHRNLKQWFKQ